MLFSAIHSSKWYFSEHLRAQTIHYLGLPAWARFLEVELFGVQIFNISWFLVATLFYKRGDPDSLWECLERKPGVMFWLTDLRSEMQVAWLLLVGLSFWVSFQREIDLAPNTHCQFHKAVEREGRLHNSCVKCCYFLRITVWWRIGHISQ